MWQRFDEQSRRVIFYSQEEAGRCGQNYVSPEHILLALLRSAGSVSWKPDQISVACRLLKHMGVSPENLRQEVLKHTPREKRSRAKDMQLTPRAKRVIDLALAESGRWHCRHVTPEHLLLALMQERSSLAGRMLAKHGITLEKLREEVSKMPMYTTLLRPTGSPSASPVTLLRPADGVAQTPADEMMRAASEPSESASSPSKNPPQRFWQRWRQRK